MSGTDRVILNLNGRFFHADNPTGTQRSALSFTRELIERHKTFRVRIFGPKRKIVNLLGTGDYDIRDVDLRSKWAWHFWEQFVWPFVSSGLAVNPLNTGPFLPFMPRQVIFAHDINLVRYPSNYSKVFWLWNQLASIRAIKRAGRLICFSEFVKDDLVHRLGIKAELIAVIPQGPGLQGLFPQKPRNRKEKYFLCVGSLQPHKNLKGCLEAWKCSGLADMGYVLCVVGKAQANYTTLAIDEGLMKQKGVNFTGYVEDVALAELYRNTTGFIYPSFDEGFGLPLVEAFCLGAPVITSNCSCLPEVAGDAALLVDPEDVQSMAKAMVRLAEDPDLRARLIEAGYVRANYYTWTRAGDELANVLSGSA